MSDKDAEIFIMGCCALDCGRLATLVTGGGGGLSYWCDKHCRKTPYSWPASTEADLKDMASTLEEAKQCRGYEMLGEEGRQEVKWYMKG